MKVLQVSTYAHGGAGIAATRLNRSLNLAGIHSKMLVMENRDAFEPEYIIEWNEDSRKKSLKSRINDWRIKKFREEMISLGGSYDWASLPQSAFDITKHPLYKEADIIHLHWAADFLDYPSFFKNITKPVVWTLHDMNPFGGCFHYDLDLKNNLSLFTQFNDSIFRIKEKVFKNLDARRLNFVCLCNWMKEELQRVSFGNKFNIDLIPNGIDTNIFKPCENKKDIKLEYGIDQTKKIILFVSDHIENKRKGFDLLIKLIRQLDDYGYLFVAIGESYGKDTIAGIHYVGGVRNEQKMSQLYSIADVFVSTARQDNLPNTVLESLACGTPVVGFDVGGIPDMVVNNYNGLLSAVGDLEELASNIVRLLEDRTLLNKFGINARSNIVEHFTSDLQTLRTINLYKKILD